MKAWVLKCRLTKMKSQKKCLKKGVDLTKEEAEAYLDELSECELKDGDLKHVAGGAKDPGQCRDLESRY